jgi:hypothetical protein
MMELTWPNVVATFIGAVCLIYLVSLAMAVGFAIWAAKHPDL